MDLFRWSKSSRNLRLHFKENVVCKRIIERFYGLDRGSVMIYANNFPFLLHLASHITSYFHACQYGFFKKINKFNNLPNLAQLYCVETATANYQYNTVKYCIKNFFNFSLDRYYEYYHYNNLLVIAISCNSIDIMNLFFEHNFFPNDNLWLTTPPLIFNKVFDKIKSFDRVEFLLQPEIKHRWDLLLTKVNHQKIHLDDNIYRNLSKEAIRKYLKTLPNDVLILERTMRSILNRDLLDECANLLSLILSHENKNDLFLTWFVFGSKQEIIYAVNHPKLIVDIHFLKKIYSYNNDCLVKFDHDEIQSAIVQKYKPDTTQHGWNIITHLNLKSHRNKLQRFIKYWVKHPQCLMNFLSSTQSPLFNDKLLTQILPNIFQTLKTSEDYQLLMKYLRIFEEINTPSFDILKLVFDKFASVASQYEFLCSLFVIASKKCQFAINLFPNLELLSDKQFLMNINKQNYKQRLKAWMNVKNIELTQLGTRCPSLKTKLFAILYIFNMDGDRLIQIPSDNYLIKRWQSNKTTFNMRFLKQQHNDVIDEFFECFNKIQL